MTYTEARIIVAVFVYVGCCVFTAVIIRDGLDSWRGQPRNPVAVALLASLPWWPGVPALLSLFALWGPM